MKMRPLLLLLCMILLLSLLTACGAPAQTETAEPDAQDAPENTSQVADASEMTDVVDVVTDDMEPVYADSLNDGFYPVKVDSSSSMFSIEDCVLQVSGDTMTATMKMGGTGYLYVYPGTAQEAAAAGEEELIPFTENSDGSHSFTIPVEALDQGVDCAAFSKRKEQWYDRTLVFRADSLPIDAFAEGAFTPVDALDLTDRSYSVPVTPRGGSGRASVDTPATLTLAEGACTARIVWSSDKYDYMVVDGEKYLPVNTEGNSTFDIPVLGFDYRMPVSADTTAMSQPHEIEYTLYFDSTTIETR